MVHTLEVRLARGSVALDSCKTLAITVHDVSQLTMKWKNRVG